MFLLLSAGVLFIVVGIAMIVMPNTTRSLDKFDNQVRGRQSQQGDRYEAGRVLRGVGLIAGGIVILLLPFLLLQ